MPKKSMHLLVWSLQSECRAWNMQHHTSTADGLELEAEIEGVRGYVLKYEASAEGADRLYLPPHT